MRDEELRVLQRELEAGSAGAELAWLRTSLRVGRLEESNLRLAAFCGNESALALLSHHGVCTCGLTRRARQHTTRCPLYPQPMAETPEALRIPVQFAPWCRALEPHGSQAVGRATVAVVSAFARACSELGVLVAPVTPLIEAWLACPCELHLEPINDFGEGREFLGPGQHYVVSLYVSSARFGWPLGSKTGVCASQWLCEIARRAKTFVHEGTLRREVVEELLPWTLGLGDPVADRVGGQPR